MLTDEQIKQKRLEICDARPKGCVVSTVEMTRQLARWVEKECGITPDHTDNSRSYLVVLKNYLAVHLLRGTSTYECAVQKARERASGNDTEYLVLEVLEDITPEASR